MDEEQKNEVERLKNEVAQLQRYYDPLKIKEIDKNNQKELIELILEKGGSFYMQVQENRTENEIELAKIDVDFAREKLALVGKIDAREKIYKGVLISVCIVAVILSAIFVDKSESVIPVLTLIIGLLFKSNSFADFLNFSKKDSSSGNDD